MANGAIQKRNESKIMLKKLIDKIFGKRCVCKTKSVCNHLNIATKKVVAYCLDCNQVMEKK